MENDSSLDGICAVNIPRTHDGSDIKKLSEFEPGYVANLSDFTFNEFYLSRMIRHAGKDGFFGRARQSLSKPMHFFHYRAYRMLNLE